MKFSDYVGYFENVAVKNKKIRHSNVAKHFYRMDIWEVLSSLPSAIEYPALILESYEGRVMDNLSDNLIDKQTGSFSIIGNAGSTDDFDLKNKILDDCKVVVMEIIAKMIWDMKQQVLIGLDVNSFTYHKVGPVFDTCYGWRVEFTIEEPDTAGFWFDAGKWL